MKSRSTPLVSIVTPVYNNEEYIAECIESVLVQTYRNWDYTIVNNCSTDKSGEIARKYAAKYPAIKVYDAREFLPAIPNHNRTLRQISPDSKYCKMVFADDWIFSRCLEEMVAVAEAHPSVGIVGAYGQREHAVDWTGLPYPSTLVSGSEVCRLLLLEDIYVFGTPTSVLYRADLVRSHDPFFNELNVHADMETGLALLRHCDFGFVHQVLTFTRRETCSRIAMSRNVNTFAASKLCQLARYGPDFLTPEELKSCLDGRVSDYYSYLAGSAIRRRPQRFWNYHKSAFRDAGVRFDRLRLARAVMKKICIAGLSPKENIKRLMSPRTPEDQAFYQQIVH